ncbi:MAG: ABC transporter ATP-binding protein [Acetobacteraceae bacterium]
MGTDVKEIRAAAAREPPASASFFDAPPSGVRPVASRVAGAAAPELEVRNLVKRYSGQSVVGPISFSVRAGEFVSLLGPSGCGKTTTLRCIAGFETPSEGGILLAGERIDEEPPNRRNIGLVFQNYALFPHLSVFENVAFGLRIRRTGKAAIKQRVERALQTVGLPEMAGRHPEQLSGGQQQRVAIARSIVLEPRVLLFDEPLSNLDLKLRLQMRTELRALQRRLGKTVVYVTHDQGEALALSDRVVVMSKGRVEQIGPPREIYERPASAFVADFIGNSNLLDVTVVEATAEATAIRTKAGLVLRGAPHPYLPGSQLVAMIRPEHIRIVSDEAGSSENRLSAVIEDVTYLGQEVQFRLRLAGQHTLMAVVQGRVTDCETGSVVAIAISRADIFLIAADR